MLVPLGGVLLGLCELGLWELGLCELGLWELGLCELGLCELGLGEEGDGMLGDGMDGELGGGVLLLELQPAITSTAVALRLQMAARVREFITLPPQLRNWSSRDGPSAPDARPPSC